MHLKKAPTPNGVRRVPVNVRSLTGEVNGQEFESSLERDLLLLVHWDHEVDWYQSQPIKIDYQDQRGVQRKYTPDLLISYRNGDGHRPSRKPVLCEVKYREDFFGQWRKLKPKLKAARRYAAEQDWEFMVFTELEIRTTYLENVKFLWSYRFAYFHEHHYEQLQLSMSELHKCSVQELLEVTYGSKALRNEALWTLWCMVARGWLLCDMNKKLTMKSTIWVKA